MIMIYGVKTNILNIGKLCYIIICKFYMDYILQLNFYNYFNYTNLLCYCKKLLHNFVDIAKHITISYNYFIKLNIN